MSNLSRVRYSSVILIVAILVYNNHLLYRYTKSPILKIDTGKLEGIIKFSRLGREYAAYMGIPYAAPPTGKLRFQPPQLATSWDGVRDASSFGPQCAHYDFISRAFRGQEDCLFVNVFSPNAANQKDPTPNRQGKLLPVLVNFHGGYFQLGGSDMIGPDYIMDEDLVLVTPAYRLGAFGFLSTGDEVIQGNMGLKDQRLSLQWVQGNIRSFGGDPDRVTIIGTSAGGASVHYHVLLGQSKGLFRRAISSSGTALASWANYQKPREQAQRLADRLNCPTEHSVIELVACLQNKTAEEIGYTSEDTAYPTRTRSEMFVPVVESQKGTGQFLTERPSEILKAGKINTVPWMSGVMASEGTFFAMAIHVNETFRNLMETKWDTMSAKILNVEDDPEIAKRMKSQYTHMQPGSESPPDLIQNFANYVDAVTDCNFNHPLQSSAHLQSRFSPVYLYYIDYKADYSLTTLMGGIKGNFNIIIEIIGTLVKHIIHRKILGTYPPFHAASHGDDMILEFPLPVPGLWIGIGHPDYEMSRDLVKSIADFTTLDDLNDLRFRNVTWSSIQSGDREAQLALRISNNPAMIIPPYTERLKFFNRYKKY